MSKKITDDMIIKVPLTWDCLIKNIFVKNQDILKLFLEATLGLSEPINSIRFLRNELTKNNINEKAKTTDILLLVNDYLITDLEFGLDSFEYSKIRNINYAEKLNLRALEVGDNDKHSKYQVVQLNIYNYPKSDKLLNDIIVNYGMISKKCYRSNPKIIVKNLAKYRELYYNGDRRKEVVILAFLTSITYGEMRNILINALNEERLEELIEEVFKMTTDSLWVEKWDYEKDHQRKLRLAKQDGLEQGKNEEKNNLIRGMFENNASIDFIAKVTKEPISKIKSIKKSLML